MKKYFFLFFFVLLVGSIPGYAQQTFTNPLLPSGADPWCIHHDGYYYYTNTTGRNITIRKTDNIANLATAEKKIVWVPPASGPYSKEIWAPEIHYLQGKWYIYFAADNGSNINHRLYVLENTSKDPMRGTWTMKGKLATPGDKWSIDGSVFEHHKQLYLIWSGWKGEVNGTQNIYIAKMKNPWTVDGKRVLLSTPTYDWETNGDLNNPNDVSHVSVNEGPEVLKHKDKLFLIYSASGCWTDTYSLGMLTAGNRSNLLNPLSWKKTAHPVFKQSVENKVYAPGHNSFFKSPDGKESWILYHANSQPGQGCGSYRSPRAQKFTWKEDGTPDFGEPLPDGLPLDIPSASGTVATGKGNHRNPALDADFPDPTVINVNGTYYAYATQTNYDGDLVNIQVASSKDLFNWKSEGDALPQKPLWCNNTQDFWAPHVLYDSALKKYVMFFSAKANDTAFDKCIGVAFSEIATGPFIANDTPLIAGKGFEDIDPMAIIDPQTGKKLLYWGSGFAPIRVREMHDDWSSFKAGSKEISLVFPGKEKQYTKLLEGAWVDYQDSTYYLYYSGDNCCGSNANYAVMVAKSKSALGPFERMGETRPDSSSVILQKDSMWNAPGHNSIVKDNDGKRWIVYHAIRNQKEKKVTPATGNDYSKRVMCVEPVKYENGWPVIIKKY